LKDIFASATNPSPSPGLRTVQTFFSLPSDYLLYNTKNGLNVFLQLSPVSKLNILNRPIQKKEALFLVEVRPREAFKTFGRAVAICRVFGLELSNLLCEECFTVHSVHSFPSVHLAQSPRLV
jgi:hypothetical protein